MKAPKISLPSPSKPKLNATDKTDCFNEIKSVFAQEQHVYQAITGQKSYEDKSENISGIKKTIGESPGIR